MTDFFDPATFLRSQTSVPKFGRLPRLFNPLVPKMVDANAVLAPPSPPPYIDYTVGMPADLGMLMNATVSDCTAAAVLHAQQVWSFNANPPMTNMTDTEAVALYSASCGYKPGDLSTDTGGDEQTVLTYWLKNQVAGNQLAAFIEIDVKDTDAVKRAIYESGVVYIGFDVPAWLQGAAQHPASTWDVQPHADNTIIGGHAVVLAGYDAVSVRVISWGSYYTMTWAFFGQFIDECYQLADAAWIKQTGQSPGGLSLAALEAIMKPLRAEASASPFNWL